MLFKFVSKTFHYIGLAAIVCGLFIGRNALGFFEEHVIEIHKPSGFEETITVAVDKNFEPFSFIDEDGEPAGAEIDILYAMANEMQVNLKFIFTDWLHALEMARNQEVDALFGLEYGKDHAQNLELTEPVFINQFVAFGREEYHDVHTLMTKKLGILVYSSSPLLFFSPLAHMDNVTSYYDYKVAMQDVREGKIDYLIGRYAIGTAQLKSLKISEVKAQGDILATSAFSFGIAKGNTELKERMNKALNTLQHNGTTLAIADKWLSTYSTNQRIYQFVLQHKNIVAPFLFFALSFMCLYIAHYIKNLKEKSCRDVATGLYNKKETERLIIKSISASMAGMMVLIDIDDFKGINDNHGHAVGDDCILLLATALRNSFRSTDIIGRIGGDEFVVYAPSMTSEEHAHAKIDQFLREFATMTYGTDCVFPLYVSIGCALHKPHEVTFAELYKLADNAMYRAKKTGKNQVCFSGEL